MIPQNKPAPHQPSNETIEFVYERDSHICQYCGDPAQGKPHHWGVHNTEYNRRHLPELVHHPANLVCVCISCHAAHGSGNNLSVLAARRIEEELRNGRNAYLQIEEDGKFIIVMEAER